MERERSRHESVPQTKRFLEEEKPPKSGFDVIYDVIPSMSKYQASVVLMALYIRFAAGSIQFAQNILQGDPESKTCVQFEEHPIENHIKSGGADLDQIRMMGADFNTTQAMNLYDVDEYGCPANQNQKCSTYNISREDIFHDTIATKHDLLCQNDFIAKHISTIQLTGCLFGGLLLGYIGDQLGRRKALLISAVGACLSSICVALFSQNLWAYTFFRFLAAGFINGSIPISLVYSVEFVGAKYRSYTGSAAYIIFDLGLAFLSLIGLTVQGWKMQAIVLSFLPLPTVLFYFYLPQSLQFTYSQNNVEEGKRVLQNLLENTNSNVSKLDELSFYLEASVSKTSSDSNSTKKSSSITTLFSSTSFTAITLKLCFLFFVSCLGNFFMVLTPDALGGNVLTNNAVIALFDALGYLLMGYMLNRLGRVRHLSFTFLAVCVTLTISVVLKSYAGDSSNVNLVIFSKILVFIGKMFNAMNFGAIFNYAAELYPTNMRSTAVGFTSSMARIGGLLAPQLNLLATIDKRLPVLVIAFLSIIAAVLSSTMPETNNKPLLQTKEEAQKFYEDNRGGFCCCK